MKLRDAIKRVEATVADEVKVAKLTPEDKIAIAALVTMGKRLLRARRALKVVVLAVSDEHHMNQTEMQFDKPDEDSTEPGT